MSAVRCGAISPTDVSVDGRSVSEPVEDQGESPRRACRFDATVGGVFGEVKDLRAVGEQRRAAFAEVETTGIELDEGGNKLGRRIFYRPTPPTLKMGFRPAFGGGDCRNGRRTTVRRNGLALPRLSLSSARSAEAPGGGEGIAPEGTVTAVFGCGARAPSRVPLEWQFIGGKLPWRNTVTICRNWPTGSS